MSGAAETSELYELIRLIRPVHRRLARAVEAKLVGTGISVGMRAVMEVLDEAGATSVPDIGRALFLARQQIQLLVNDLEKLGLIGRHPNPAHKRSPLFALTDSGRTQFGEIRAGEDADIALVSKRFSSAEVAAAQQVVCALLDHFAEFEDDPNRPRGLE
ncbi:MarR family winged helix-turn-helix transcriptional regulator [Roseibium polysiphoniae]|uniref:MarR family transcriptional regulator n=1 Tax=Roseibium polysiphoniae TaxID=2571221 RepID=A0ABR9CDM6_9HYPH|nr:MarR family transcriptional regulator [Roseibium polysiphoniae]MBD8877994.1 MarR family transcriptional regulator [Roseibium polysiphoniae]